MVKLKKPPVWIWFFVFFGVIFIANAIMINFANTSWNGLAKDQAYEAGIAYNQTLAKRKAEAKLDWALATHTTAKQLTLTVHQSNGAPLAGATVQLLIQRPTTQGFDQTMAMVETTAGTYIAPLALPMTGQWHATFTINHGDDSLTAEKRLYIP